jgi:hypothetical protein
VSFEPIHLAVLVSMPMPPARWKVAHRTGGPPVVEFGVTNVECAPLS